MTAPDEQMIAEIRQAIVRVMPSRTCMVPSQIDRLARAAHSVMAGKAAELEELVDELVERGLGCGAFDDPSPLWTKASKVTGRDPDTGNRAALALHPEGTK